jgi:hypothetical protein
MDDGRWTINEDTDEKRKILLKDVPAGFFF